VCGIFTLTSLRTAAALAFNISIRAVKELIAIKKINADKNFNAGTTNYKNQQRYDLTQNSEIQLCSS